MDGDSSEHQSMIRLLSILTIILALAGLIVVIINSTVCTKDVKKIECRVGLLDGLI